MRTTNDRALGRWAKLATGSVGLVLAMGALVTSALGTTYINLTTSGAAVTFGGAVFIQGGVGAGTGQFDPFLTLSSNADTEKGYNTTAASGEFDTFFGGGRTHPLKASAIPPTTYSGTVYREFSLDANDQGSDDFMSIDAIKIFLDSQNNLTGFNTGTNTFSNDTGTAAQLIYDLGDGIVLMRSQALTPGSGVSDITVLIPDSLFPADCFYGSTTCTQWVYFYTESGFLGTTDEGVVAGTQNWNVTAGFEEWRTRLLPVVNVTKTATPSFTRTFDWTLQKQVSVDGGTTWQDSATVNLFNGQSQNYLWRLVATKSAGVDSNAQVTGTITIFNPTGGAVITTAIDAVINSVSDALTLGGVTTNPPVTCPVSFPFTLKAQETLTCTYSSGTVTTNDGSNVATANIDNGTGGTNNYNSPAVPITWASVTPTLVDNSASIVDALVPGLNQSGIVATGTFTSTTQTYTCGSTTTITNSATLTEGTSGQTRTDSASLTVNCFGLTVAKTANTALTRTFDWTLVKEVSIDGGTTWQDSATVNLFNGQSQDYLWRLIATKSAPIDSGWVVSGTITVHNPAPMVTPTVTVTDALSIDGAATVSCPATTTIPASGDLVCTYTKSVASPTDQTNTATATLAGQSYQGSAPVTFGAPTITLVDNSASIVDALVPGLNQTGIVATGTFVSSTQNYACGSTTTITNSATLTEADSAQTRTDTAALTINCFGLSVSKTANTTFTRTWTWTIDKSSSDPTTITLQPTQSFLYHYSVTVNATSADSAFGVNGTITVHNPAPMVTPTVTVTDTLSIDGAATVSCPATTIPAGGNLVCTYSKSLSAKTNQTNTATATMVGQSYNSSAVNVTFGSPTTVTDECITVTDTFAGTLGTVCAGVDTLPKTFTYTRTFGPFGTDCGDHVITNTATFTTNDTSTQGSDSWTVTITVPCPKGCTLTQGYWKTHSAHGPAPTDPTWTAASGSVWDTGFGPDSTFYLSGQTYYQVMWTASNGGNVYYILAQQYIAALLNIRAGAATTPAVVSALNDAQAFFLAYTPTSSLTKAQRAELITVAGTLTSYNEGLIGPGHCPEETAD